MGTLASHAEKIGFKKDIIIDALVHFDGIFQEGSKEFAKVKAAADAAFGDDLLFEHFQYWKDDRDDEILLYHINHYFETIHLKSLSNEERDLTSRREEVEASIKQKTREIQKQIFGRRITLLAAEKRLETNEALGKFLGVSAEQARRFKAGENKPQLGTLNDIASKFNVSIEYLSGLKDDRD